MRLLLYVGLGAAAGGMSRFALTAFIQQRSGADFPVGTLVINITGSFLLGLIMAWALRSDSLTPELRALLTTGFCGGYTTFSTFSYETWQMVQRGELGRAGGYVAASVVMGVGFLVLGMEVGRRA